MKTSRLQKIVKRTSPTRMFVVSFLILIFIGTVLLTLPISAKSGRFTNPVDALFTATSATCVTGLSVYDTFIHWSYFGQGVLLVLIQCGGLGLAAFATGLTLLVRRRIGIRHLVLARESAGGSNLDVISLLRIVVAFTFAVEALGALLLMVRFVPLYGGLGAWASVFVSVSAFCNAGFDILSFIPGNSSLSAFNGDPLVTLTISMLIIIGSTGFVVFQDIYRKKISTRLHRQHVEKLSFHAQVCLRASLTLLVFGTVMLFILEYNNTYRDLNFFEKLNAAFFQSVNTRTAGFASVSWKNIDRAAAEKAMEEAKLTMDSVFIGGCPGSTAGGIKVTTLVVLFAAVKSTLCGEDTTTFLRHRFDPGMVYKSLTVVAFALVVSVLNVSLILALHHGVSILDAMIEAVSAFATVGLSASLTPTLHPLAKLALTLTMFIGRVGPVSFGVAILMRKKKSGSVLPEGRMLIG
mgnify:CR=1 FL=1